MKLGMSIFQLKASPSWQSVSFLTADLTSGVEASNVTLCRLFDEHLKVYTFGENDMATARNILA